MSVADIHGATMFLRPPLHLTLDLSAWSCFGDAAYISFRGQQKCFPHRKRPDMSSPPPPPPLSFLRLLRLLLLLLLLLLLPSFFCSPAQVLSPASPS
ncbi:hypothetical protein K440DRAFT_142262 [Wilcoxina mikolae CBS 423.85]|nr:hypothetical protein K440DRAFT_142262 [Wilcoxina mikolae CBS 423.85]